MSTVTDFPPTRVGTAGYDTLAFPYIYPGAYSVPEPNAVQNGLGWIHSLDPANTLSDPNPSATSGYSFNFMPARSGR